MRIGIVSTQSPFIVGGAERHAANLRTALLERGFEACEISIPFKPFPARPLVDSVLAARLIDLSELGYPVDMVVGLKFPAYLVRHPEKVYWVLHQHRQAYDLWEAGLSELRQQPEGHAVRELIRAEDMAALGAPGARVYANSNNVAGRMRRYLGLESTPLYHPPPNAGRLRAGPYGDYLFAPSRLGPHKRQTLMIEALAHCDRSVRLVIAGPPDSPSYLDELKKLAKSRGVDNRVTFLGPIDDETMIRHYAECRGVVFVPVDEDYGYITLEAMLSGKPVVTVTDAGGPLEFIRDGREGVVAAPDPKALGAAFDRVMRSADEAEAMGRAGRATFEARGISWDTVVATLTEGHAPVAPDAAPPEPDQGHAPPAALAPADPERIADRLRPPMPRGVPFDRLDGLFEAYAFGTYPGDWETKEALHRPYFATHWRRLLASVAAIEAVPGKRILDIGIVPPFVFQALLASMRPGAEIDGIWSEDGPFSQTVHARREGLPHVSVHLHPADVESDPLPLAAESRDIVLAMEILEHLAVDPTFFLAEANRVLAHGGHLLITTPNMASHRGVAKALGGQSPYSFGLFVPVGGVHGRHNREYAPEEVARLGEAAGFETVSLATHDVYDDRIDPEVARLLTARGDDFLMRGETIFWLGRKTGRPGAAPERMFHGRPEQLSARLSLASRDGEGITVRALNTSRATWRTRGAFAVSLWLEWRDECGRIVHQGGAIPLPRAVAPGEAVEIRLPLAQGGRAGTLGIELFEEGAGRFVKAGRANALSLAASEDVFLALCATDAP